jgi:hypothetical protein
MTTVDTNCLAQHGLKLTEPGSAATIGEPDAAARARDAGAPFDERPIAEMELAHVDAYHDSLGEYALRSGLVWVIVRTPDASTPTGSMFEEAVSAASSEFGLQLIDAQNGSLDGVYEAPTCFRPGVITPGPNG